MFTTEVKFGHAGSMIKSHLKMADVPLGTFLKEFKELR
jgi:hypothetical protein